MTVITFWDGNNALNFFNSIFSCRKGYLIGILGRQKQTNFINIQKRQEKQTKTEMSTQNQL